mmetsp:Transcript_26513/g.62066  ORF Transcript_26513/g.62066 Transcript_26513/m.62066 type:complete len:84 (+) Transcript_26513:446-697(+)
MSFSEVSVSILGFVNCGSDRDRQISEPWTTGATSMNVFLTKTARSRSSIKKRAWLLLPAIAVGTSPDVHWTTTTTTTTVNQSP